MWVAVPPWALKFDFSSIYYSKPNISYFNYFSFLSKLSASLYAGGYYLYFYSASENPIILPEKVLIMNS